MLLLVGQRFEACERLAHVDAGEVGAELLQPFGEGMPARVLAEHQTVAGQPDALRAHDLVGLLVLQNPVLVDAGFVREGVVAHHRFVDRDQNAGDLRQQAAGGVDLPGVDPHVDGLEDVAPGLDRHHHLFERGVAGALADAVDGAFDLTGPVAHRHQ